MKSANEGTPAEGQHSTPCEDCPWRRQAIPGWLGSQTAQQWVRDAHGEVQIYCHVHLGAQCAGAATYRANVCKVPRDHGAMRLPADRKTVFAMPNEFLEHHGGHHSE